MPKLEFRDQRLRDAVEQSKSAVEERLQKLDRVSHDIKQLERYLDDSGVREGVEFLFADGTAAVGDPAEAQASGEAAAEEVHEFVAWEKLADQDRWRLMYFKTHRDGWFSADAMDEIPGGFSFEREAKVLEHRPLIETASEVRLRASEALPELVTAIAANARVSRLA